MLLPPLKTLKRENNIQRKNLLIPASFLHFLLFLILSIVSLLPVCPDMPHLKKNIKSFLKVDFAFCVSNSLERALSSWSPVAVFHSTSGVNGASLLQSHCPGFPALPIQMSYILIRCFQIYIGFSNGIFT